MILYIIDILKKPDAKSALKYIELYFKKNTRFFNLFISDYKNAFWIKYDQNEFKSFVVPYGFSIIDNYDLNDNKSPKQKLYRDIFLKKRVPDPSINYFKSWQDLLFLEYRDRKYDQDIYTIRGVYNVQDIDFNLSQFGLFELFDRNWTQNRRHLTYSELMSDDYISKYYEYVKFQ